MFCCAFWFGVGYAFPGRIIWNGYLLMLGWVAYYTYILGVFVHDLLSFCVAVFAAYCFNGG